jgi:DNA polymerase elongation subunit (family B)
MSKHILNGKSFKLIDFLVYDEKPKRDSDSDGSSSEEEKKKQKKNTDENQFIIQMFGLDKNGETCSILVNDYKPFFYIKCGDNWIQSNVDTFLSELKQKIGTFYKNSILSAKLVEYNKLYGFTAGKKSKFIEVTFKNVAVMNKTKYLWYEEMDWNDTSKKERKQILFRSQGVNLALYESNLPPLLRYFHIHNISPSGWVFVRSDSNNNTKIRDELKATTCKYEYVCSGTQVIAQSNKDTIVPYKVCSFDIEASSSHGDFPIPIKSYKRLAANMIDVYYKQKKAMTDKTKSMLLIEKMIFSAFNFSSFHDIDIVYPKIKVSKKEIEMHIKNLFTCNINDSQHDVDSSITSLLTIESAFEKIRESQEDNLGNGGDDETGQENNNGEEIIVITKGKTKTKKNDVDVMTIIDLLNSYDGKNRDEKVQKLNTILTTIFPALEGDKVTFIGSTFTKYGSTEPYLNHCLVMDFCDDVPGVVIKSVKTEAELLKQWADLIQKENPDIIIGYNIFGFDYEFMFRRSQETGCETEFLSLSRKKHDICGKYDKVTMKYTMENTKIMLATGEYDLKFPKIAGRVQIDLYSYFRRDFNLSSYKLDDVAGQFISDDIKHISNGDVTELFTNNIMGIHINDYIHIEVVGFTSDYYECETGNKFLVVDIKRDVMNADGKVYNVISIREKIDTNILTGKGIKWCLCKDDVTPQDIFRLSNGSSTERAIVAKYCIQDCNLVNQLFNKIDVITGYVEMSGICSVPISFLVFRGQGIKLTSYVAKKCRLNNTLMPDLQKSYDPDGYEGAIVLPPKCAMYMDNPVACVDYASLYPSSMISQNYSHDSKVWSKEYDLDGTLIKETGEKDPKKGNFIYDNLEHLGYKYVDIEFDSYKYIKNESRPSAKAEKTKVGKKICRWVQLPNNEKSIMPTILEELLKARADTRKLIKTTKDPFMQNILDKRQLGYKVTANSLYGQCGAKTSTFYEQDVAASTTATGRMMITYAQRIIEETYGNLQYESKCHGSVKCHAEYVYGDTDSVFFTFNLKDSNSRDIRGKKALEITIEIAQDVAKLCTQFLTPPMELTYEKTLMQFILLSKKRYTGILYETDPNKGKLKYMGLSLKRRDSSDYLKDTYGNILNILMKDNLSNDNSNIKDAIAFLDKSLLNLIEGKVSMEKLTITKALRGYYKNPAQIAHQVLADRIGDRDPGSKPKSGERVKFVHIVSNNKKALQGQKIETPEFIIQNKLVIDYSFYITNQIMKPLQQLFGLALDKIWEIKNKSGREFNNELLKLEKECNTEEFMKKKEKICSDKIKILLFKTYLDRIYNNENRIQPITSFFRHLT